MDYIKLQLKIELNGISFYDLKYWFILMHIIESGTFVAVSYVLNIHRSEEVG